MYALKTRSAERSMNEDAMDSSRIVKKLNYILRSLSQRANYTGLATATCRRS
jgi:hypothetical protein